MDALFIIQRKVPVQRPLLGSVYIHLEGTDIGTPGVQFATVLQGNEIEHREMRFVVHEFEASKTSRGASLGTLNEGDVFHNLAGVFSLRVLRGKVLQIIREVTNAYWADFSWYNEMDKFEETQIPKSFSASIIMMFSGHFSPCIKKSFAESSPNDI
ncbi:hypothetical protein T265_05551 [Opisthorchis viverrini]|uniref:Uncharacterized protein n=1 Tax=Opisthorchis viverrini TaxID=6198 RepID=A0A074ZJZ5_OPIVI|nr:hypothetical protein T265_05551 [Opisthorchis viverrini]KER27371.1 hypothetical protein T265_05551 [Opisthorchis viverrini]